MINIKNNIFTSELIGDKEVRVYGTSVEPWFVGKDIADMLGYVNTEKAIKKHVDDEDKITCNILKRDRPFSFILDQISSLQGSTILINKRGFRCFIQYGKKHNPKLLRWYESNFGVPTDVIKRLSKEEEYITYILEAFKGENMVIQYLCTNYRIDLYFTDYKLAIECDEHGHSDRNPEEELTRENYIKRELKCDFLRFNPDSPTFSIFEVFNSIKNKIEVFKQESKEKTTMSVEMINIKNNIFTSELIGDKELRVYGTSKDPWFVGKDIASMLRYKDTKKAISDNVDIEDKVTCRKFNVREGGFSTPLP
jgi:prophage antirepressor-like protein/very-short-patch-repair endonuclease